MKKNYGVLIGLVVLLAVAVFVNVKINQNALNKPQSTLQLGVAAQGGDELETAVAEEVFFETFRVDRENTRETELSYLDSIIGNEQTDAETLQDAQQQKLAIVDYMEKEFTIESLLKAKGFADAAVTFHKGTVNVVIKATELSDPEVAQILDIVCRETGEEASNVKVSTLR